MAHYLDHNAATPLLPEAREAMLRSWQDGYGNPSSLHGQGRSARSHLEEAREIVAGHLGCAPAQVIFTSGGTESDHLALRGVMAHPRTQKKRLLVSAFEHPAVLETARDLAKQGFESVFIPPGEDGTISPDALAGLLNDETALVSVLLAHNEIGTVQPIAELASLARNGGALFHTDAVQALGKLGPLNAASLGVDLMSLSGHKIGGPKGVGALFLRPGTPFKAMQLGGPQERQFRAGTENVAACLGMAAALQVWERRGEEWRRRMRDARDAFETQLMQFYPETEINGAGAERLPNTSHITLPYCPSDLMVAALDLRGVQISAGSACASGSVKVSQAMLAMGKDKSRSRCVLRFSLGPDDGAEKMADIANIVAQTARRVKLPDPSHF